MKTVFPALLVATFLTACGGGGSDAPAPSAPVSTQPAPAAAGTPTTTAPVATETPPAAPAGMTYSSASMNVTSSGKDYVVNFNGTTNLTLNGNLNRAWIDAAQSGGSIVVNGESNTLVLKLNATPASVNVTGANNTFYLPQGSAIKIEGTGAAQTTVKYYKP